MIIFLCVLCALCGQNIPEIGFVLQSRKSGYFPIILSLHIVYVNLALCQIGFVFSK